MAKRDAAAFQRNLRRLCAGRQAAVAKSAGISLVFLNRIINGHASPSLAVACDIARALSVELADLLERSHSPAA